MAVKSCVKAAIWKLRYMANVKRRGARLLNLLEEDTVAEFGPVTIEAEAEPVAEDVRVETTAAPPAPETQTRQAPAPQTQQAPAQPAATGKKPGRPKMTEEERMAAALKRQRDREAGELAEKLAQAAAQEAEDPSFQDDDAREGDYFEAGEGEEEPFLPDDEDDPTSL